MHSLFYSFIFLFSDEGNLTESVADSADIFGFIPLAAPLALRRPAMAVGTTRTETTVAAAADGVAGLAGAALVTGTEAELALRGAADQEGEERGLGGHPARHLPAQLHRGAHHSPLQHHLPLRTEKTRQI